MPYLSEGASVLDIGCGPGTITLDVSELVKPGKVDGIDVEQDAIEKASELAAERGVCNASFRVMDTRQLDFGDETFDVVFSHTALHSFRTPVGALKEQKRVAKKGGWVIAAGVRDWGLVPRYPPTPAWDKAYDALVRYEDFWRDRPGASESPLVVGGHPQAARRCSEWFVEAGLENLDLKIKVYRVRHPGADDMQPDAIDLLPYGEAVEEVWHALFQEFYQAMLADGYTDQATLDEAVAEARARYNDPRAFHFWVMVFAAGRA